MCQFIDYAPRVFSLIRNLNNIQKDHYLHSLGTESLGNIIKGQNFFKGLKSAGKSGSFFFTSADDKYFVKTIPDREFDVAIEILDVYLNFLGNATDSSGVPKTLISK